MPINSISNIRVEPPGSFFLGFRHEPILVGLCVFSFVHCWAIALWLNAWWRQQDDTISFSDLPNALLRLFAPSYRGGSSGWDISCKWSCFRRTCNVRVLPWHTAAVRCMRGTILCSPLSYGSTTVSSALRPAVLLLFCSFQGFCLLFETVQSLVLCCIIAVGFK